MAQKYIHRSRVNKANISCLKCIRTWASSLCHDRSHDNLVKWYQLLLTHRTLLKHVGFEESIKTGPIQCHTIEINIDNAFRAEI